jgi:hypothetical protein
MAKPVKRVKKLFMPNTGNIAQLTKEISAAVAYSSQNPLQL